MIILDEEECLRLIAEEDYDAGELLGDHLPKAERQFKALDKRLRTFLADVQKTFPDAQYYTASGGFNLLLGRAHGGGGYGQQQQQLIALSGKASIGDGDF